MIIILDDIKKLVYPNQTLFKCKILPYANARAKKLNLPELPPVKLI